MSVPVNSIPVKRLLSGELTLAPRLGTWMLAAATTFALFSVAAFYEEMTTSRLFLVLIALLVWHSLVCPRIYFSLESRLYSAFVAYLFVVLLWTEDVVLALNTMFPAVDSLLTLLLVGSLLVYHDRRVVIHGMLSGFIAGCVVYTVITGFPMSMPTNFSYNSVALAYVFGLFLVVIYGCVRRARVIAAPLALVVLLHIAMTTSIKTNLGVILGAATAGLFHFAVARQLIRRNLVLLVLGAGAAAYMILTSDLVKHNIEYGFERISIGLQVLQAREDVQGYAGFNERKEWMQTGLAAVAYSPVFGHGVEAFRADFGATSHSSVVDLLYNTGILGLALFYSVAAALAMRLYRERSCDAATRATVLAGLVCFTFMSFSGTLFYHPLFAALVAVGAALCRRPDQPEESS